MVTILIAVYTAKADTPLPPPTKVIVISPSERMRAISEPKAGTHIEDTKRHKVLWCLPDWHRSLSVANDGKHLVTQYDGLNLIPIDFTDDLVLLTFGATEKGFAISRSEISYRTITFCSILLRTIIGASSMASTRRGG